MPSPARALEKSENKYKLIMETFHKCRQVVLPIFCMFSADITYESFPQSNKYIDEK